MPDEITVKPKPKLRWYQFSLRTLLILVTLFACACSWFAVKMEQARRQRLAVEEIERLGAVVFHNFGQYYRGGGQPTRQLVLHPDGSWREEIDPDSKLPAWFANLLGDDFLYYVTAIHVKNSSALDCIQNFPRCTALTIFNLEVNDALAERLEKLTQLKTIVVDIKPNDPALEKLRKLLPNCQISAMSTDYDILR